METFTVNPAKCGFPFAEQAARLTRLIQNPGKPPKEPEIEFLITSLPPEKMSAKKMLQADRAYWGIETGLHLRLDVTAGEDRSKVRGKGALNLGVIRRAVVSAAIRWIRNCKNKRLATLSGFYDAMASQNSKLAFKIVTACKRTPFDNS